MSPSSHPSEAVLCDYVSGALRPAFAAVVAAHLEHCPHCRETTDALEAVGGELIAGLDPSPLAPDALARALAAIERPRRPAPASPPVAARIAFGRPTYLGPGMSVSKARPAAGSDLLYLLRLPAGIRTLPHAHAGAEFTTVLAGAFRDGDQVFAKGDFAEQSVEAEHQPQVLRDGPCVCLIASEKPMKVHTLAGWIIQAMARV